MPVVKVGPTLNLHGIISWFSSAQSVWHRDLALHDDVTCESS